MITETIIYLFIKFFENVFKLFPVVENFTIPVSALGVFIEFLTTCSYFLPLRFLFSLFCCRIALEVVDISFKIIFRIKSFIPTMGN